MGRKERRFFVLFALACFFAGAFILVQQARAASRPPVPPDVFTAVRAHWQERADRVKAFDVIACETGGRYNTTATNGQYLGLFQMGQWARSRYGHGETARAQARAAYRYWRKSGWAGWSCA